MKRPLAYITAPWSNSQYENAENAAAYCRQVYDAGYSPICPVLFLPTFLKDEIPQEHKDGLDMARDYLRRSHVLVVCGHGIDETVKNDIATAERLRITATTLDGISAPMSLGVVQSLKWAAHGAAGRTGTNGSLFPTIIRQSWTKNYLKRCRLCSAGSPCRPRKPGSTH